MKTKDTEQTEENTQQDESDSVQRLVMQEEYTPECREVPVDDIRNAMDSIRISKILIKERLDQITPETPSYVELATWKSLKVDLVRAENSIIRLTTILA